MRVTGISWVLAAKHGALRLRRHGAHKDLRELYETLRADGTMTAPPRNVGRFDEHSRRVCLSVALALQDAEISAVNGEERDIGLLVSSTDGAAQANVAYFRDYVEGGRKLGRGNLFIYTLPTSPAAEAAIHFALRGPLLYVGRPVLSPAAALRDTVRIIRAGQTQSMLCIVLQEAAAVCVVVRNEPLTGQTSVTIEQAAHRAELLLRGQTESDGGFCSAAEERATIAS